MSDAFKKQSTFDFNYIPQNFFRRDKEVTRRVCCAVTSTTENFHIVQSYKKI